MKPIRTFITAVLALLTGSIGLAATPASTFTFAPPCARFTTVSVIPNTKSCYAFGVTNTAAGDLDSYYTWSFGDGQSATGKNVYHCYSINSTTPHFSVSLAYVSPSCPTEPVQQVYTTTLTLATPTNCNFDPTVTVSGLSASITPFQGPMIPESSFDYSFGDGSPVTTTLTNGYATHTYTACGSYILYIKMYNWFGSPGCFTYTSVNIPCNNTGTVTGIAGQKAEAQVRLFPNPAQSQLTLTSDVALKQVTILDLTGRVMTTTVFLTENISPARLNIQDLTPGTYVLQLQAVNGTKKNMKFIKE